MPAEPINRLDLDSKIITEADMSEEEVQMYIRTPTVSVRYGFFCSKFAVVAN
jgi:hypothetical protein